MSWGQQQINEWMLFLIGGNYSQKLTDHKQKLTIKKFLEIGKRMLNKIMRTILRLWIENIKKQILHRNSWRVQYME